jgi:hypothetical protein
MTSKVLENRKNIKVLAKESLNYYELKKHKPWFDEECSQLIGKRKLSKLQWLHNHNQTEII